MPQPNANQKILFASYHCIADPSCGAAISTQDTLLMLSRGGWEVRALCGPLMDGSGRHPQEIAEELKIPSRLRNFRENSVSFSTLDFRIGAIASSTFLPRPSNRSDHDDIAVFLNVYDRLLDHWRPDVVLTYGDSGVGSRLMELAHERDAHVVFGLNHNSYTNPDFFRDANTVLAASQTSAKRYRETLGLECAVLDTPLVLSRVRHRQAKDPRFLTFVNPRPENGVTVVARIASELARRRKDIPILVVEGHIGVDWLARCGIDLSDANIHYMKNTADPRNYYSVSKMVLMPSLWEDTFGRVAVEAMGNGIPVLATTRGAIPEIVADGGFLFDIPGRYTPENRQSPEAVELREWIDTIIRLWDDSSFYQQASARALARAEHFSEDRTSERYNSFFRELIATDAHTAPRR